MLADVSFERFSKKYELSVTVFQEEISKILIQAYFGFSRTSKKACRSALAVSLKRPMDCEQGNTKWRKTRQGKISGSHEVNDQMQSFLGGKARTPNKLFCMHLRKKEKKSSVWHTPIISNMTSAKALITSI